MAKIDTKNWGLFTIKNYFEANNTGNILARDVEDGSGKTPFVTASGINNGVVGHIDASKYNKIRGHCILVGGKTFTLTYQEQEFVSNDSHNFEMHLKKERGINVYLFLISAIRASLSSKYSWGDAVTKEKLLKQSISLPKDKKGEPDWDFMEKYMQGIHNKVNGTLNALLGAITPPQ